jgi:hypothetical protein
MTSPKFVEMLIADMNEKSKFINAIQEVNDSLEDATQSSFKRNLSPLELRLTNATRLLLEEVEKHARFN